MLGSASISTARGPRLGTRGISPLLVQGRGPQPAMNPFCCSSEKLHTIQKTQPARSSGAGGLLTEGAWSGWGHPLHSGYTPLAHGGALPFRSNGSRQTQGGSALA